MTHFASETQLQVRFLPILIMTGVVVSSCGSSGSDAIGKASGLAATEVPTAPTPVAAPDFTVSAVISPQPDYTNNSVDKSNVVDGIGLVPSGVVLVTGLDGRKRAIIFPSLFNRDPQLPGFELLQSDQQTHALTRFLPVTMGAARAWAEIDPRITAKKQYVVVDHGPEYSGGYSTWPFGHVWTLTDSGDGFQVRQVSTFKGFYHSVTVVDVDRDGRDDIVASNMGVKNGGIQRSIHLFRQQANGDFLQDIDFMPTIGFDGTGAVGSGDLDGDSVPEIVQANYLSDGNPNDWGALRVWRAGGGHQYVEAAKLPREGLFRIMGATQVVPFDHDGDGDLDLLVSLEGQTPEEQSSRYTGHGVEVFRNDGSLSFTRVTDALLSPSYWSSKLFSYRELAITDFNLDGRPDIFLQLNGGLRDNDGSISLGKAILINEGGARFRALGDITQLKATLPLNTPGLVWPYYLRFVSKAGDANQLFGMLSDGRPFTLTVRYGR